MGSITRHLRLNPWTAQDVRSHREPEPVHYDFTEPDTLDPLINKAGTLFVRLTGDQWSACGAPENITVTITGIDTLEGET